MQPCNVGQAILSPAAYEPRPKGAVIKNVFLRAATVWLRVLEPTNASAGKDAANKPRPSVRGSRYSNQGAFIP